jgi:hypothetical protein
MIGSSDRHIKTLQLIEETASLGGGYGHWGYKSCSKQKGDVC